MISIEMQSSLSSTVENKLNNSKKLATIGEIYNSNTTKCEEFLIADHNSSDDLFEKNEKQLITNFSNNNDNIDYNTSSKNIKELIESPILNKW